MNLQELQQQYQTFCDKELSLNIERGQPADANFDLSLPILTAVDNNNFITDNGIDVRNYPGGVHGLKEARELFCEQINVSPDEITIGKNSSLDLMSRLFTWALLNGVNGSSKGWIHDKPKMLVTIPGYDRHFTLVQALGFELVTVPMTDTGPDVERIASLCKDDPTVKGLFFVPTYSNPTGATLSESVAKQLVSMPTAASDCLLYTSPSPRDRQKSRMPSSA